EAAAVDLDRERRTEVVAGREVGGEGVTNTAERRVALTGDRHRRPGHGVTLAVAAADRKCHREHMPDTTAPSVTEIFHDAASIDYPILDCDAHVNEPPDTWVGRVPAKFRERAPKIVHRD